jgi:hypothetical protein
MTIGVNDLYSELGQLVGPFAPLVNLGSVGAWSLREMGYPTASPFSVTDDDLVPVVAEDVNELVDFCRYQASERILDNLDPVQLKQIGIDEDVQDLRKSWRIRVEGLMKRLKDKYNYGIPTLSSGVVDMDFQSRGDDVTLGGWM